MLDINLLRRDLDGVIARLETRKTPQRFLDREQFTALETERKRIQTRTEELQAQRNSLSKQIGQLKAKGQDVAPVMAQVAGLGDELAASAVRNEALQSEICGRLDGPAEPASRQRAGWRRRDMRTPKSGAGAARVPSTSRSRIMSISVRHWAWISTPAPSCRARASPSCVARLRACTARWRSSCSTCRPSSTATPSATHPTSSTATSSRAPGSCRSSRTTCSGCHGAATRPVKCST